VRSIRLLLLAGLAVTGSASAATFTVTNSNDSGPGSLRAAIIAANANADLDTIEFAVGTQPITINLLTPLPEVTAPVRIDGWTQPGTRPSVRISGASVGSNSAPLLGLFASACTQANCFVRGLMLVEGKAAGLRISGGGWTVQGNFVGTNGIQAQPNAGNGLVVSTGGNLVGGTTSAQRNLIAGNGGIGLTISGSNNVVTGNYIGTSQLGLAALPNGGGGISVIGGSGVRIGGTSTNERNVIAGNAISQIDIGGSVNGIEILGNRVGIGADGATAMSPNGAGIVINGRSVQIAANVVSGNGHGGIAVMSGASENVVIAGNLVGLNATGNAAVPNGGIGIRIAAGAGITVGGFAAGSGNRIAASQQFGVAIESGAIGVTVAGNSIGTDITGNVALQPGAIGVGLAGSEVSLIGNLVSGNGQGGISVGGAQVDAITIAGNRIGTNADGTAALPNGGIGVRVTNGTNVSIGGVTEAARNVIAASQSSNLTLEGGVNGAEVVNNRIGTNLAGDAALSPNAAGVGIGGRNINFRDNVVSGNGNGGIAIDGNLDGVTITGSRIGTNAAGTAALPNGGIGVRAVSGRNLVIGGSEASERNVIAASQSSNLTLEGGVDGAQVVNNRIGTNLAGDAALSPNAAGVGIGGRNISFRDNVVSGNGNGGIAIDGNVDGVAITGNRIGTNAAGTAALPNGGIGIRAMSGRNIRIGGPMDAERNVIAAGQSSNLTLEGGIDGAQVVNNRIGTNLAGDAALSPNAGGVSIGGRNISFRDNVVSGNGNGGISISGDVDGVAITGNRIGTNAAGTAALPNGSIAIRAISGRNIRIGGPTDAERNVIAAGQSSNLTLEGGIDGAQVINNRIGTNLAGDAALSPNAGGVSIGGRNIQLRNNLISGNANGGVAISGDVDGVTMTGNRIGTNAAGTQALANGSYGIRAISGRGVRIGGAGAGEGNLVSGNARGVAIEQAMREVVLEGNTIGLDANRSARIPNGDWNGLDVAAPGTVVGGTTPGSGNVIAGNQGSGIFVQGEAASGSVIRGNFIGTNPAGVAGLGNDAAGIRVRRSHAVSIGGTAAGAGNLIAHNRFNGIVHQAGDGISVQGNRIRDNDFLGIEIEPQGPSINDPLDADGGANHGQNFPIITSALASGGQVTIGGFLDSEPQKDYLVEIVHNPACDPSGLGEGATSLGFVIVTTDAAGRATFGAQLPLPSASGVVAALATAPDGSTSEFSPCHALTGPNPGSFQFWRRPFQTWEGLPHLVVTVVRSGGNAGPASVRVFTQDDSATAPADYGAIDTRLEFADGEVLKTLLVPIVADNLQEGQEQFLVRLGSPLGGATLGPQATSEAIIIDVGPDFPMYFIDDVSVDEPSSGQATATFTVTMTPNTQPFTVQWSTSDGTAVAGSDYVAASGQLVFPPSAVPQSRTLVVPVLADADPEEGNEVFYVDLSATGNIAVFRGTGIGTIRQPSAPRPDALFSNGFE
jgi:hypothetical protein